MTEPLIRAEGLTKIYQRGVEQVHALTEATFAIARGEFVAIVGPSGAGKTTLLNLLGCLDTPTSGSLTVAGHEVRGISERNLTRLRREQIGFVFQHFGLIPTLTVAENVALPCVFSRRHAGKRIDDLLARVGLSHRRSHRPAQLSGGEMQRVAVARALVNEPSLLLADEPTGNLDSATGRSLIELLTELNAGGLTLVVVTHNADLAAAASRRLVIGDGRVSEESAVAQRRPLG